LEKNISASCHTESSQFLLPGLGEGGMILSIRHRVFNIAADAFAVWCADQVNKLDYKWKSGAVLRLAIFCFSFGSPIGKDASSLCREIFLATVF
jgi:hypothetical protein